MLSQDEIKERHKIFNSTLLNIVNYYQKTFFKNNSTSFIDAFKSKPHLNQFNIENIPEIPIFEMKEKPIIRFDSIGAFIKRNDLKTILVNKALINLENRNDKHIKTFTEGKQKEQSILTKFLSPSLIEKVIINCV